MSSVEDLRYSLASAEAECERLREQLAEKVGELAVAYGGHDRDGTQAQWFSALDREKARSAELREQLDAARGLVRERLDLVEVQAHESLLAIKATVQRARAALGVEGEQKPT